jgi:raffinose/stachyose/melibiose transport system permease protein
MVIFPIYVTFVTAFKTTEASSRNFFSLPASLYLDNFKQVMSDPNFWNYVKNSVVVTVIAVGIIAIMVPMVSYSIARNMNRSRYYKFIYTFFVVSVFCPFTVLMFPVSQICNKLHLMNQAGLIILYCTFSLGQGVFLFTGFYKSIPIELEEAAGMDGCGLMKTFWKIIFPISKPMVATIIILNTLWIWNDFLLPLIILNRSADMWTLPIYQYNFKTAYTFRFNLAFASFLFSIIPMIFMYIGCQKYIIEGLTAGAVKS